MEVLARTSMQGVANVAGASRACKAVVAVALGLQLEVSVNGSSSDTLQTEGETSVRPSALLDICRTARHMLHCTHCIHRTAFTLVPRTFCTAGRLLGGTWWLRLDVGPPSAVLLGNQSTNPVHSDTLVAFSGVSIYLASSQSRSRRLRSVRL